MIEQAISRTPASFFIRELCRDIGEQINSVRRELINLENLGILKSREEDTKKMYCLNRNNCIYEELSGVFLKSYNPMERIEEYIRKKKTVDVIAYSEHLRHVNTISPNGIVDIFVIGRLDKTEFNALLEKAFFGRSVKYATMLKELFLERIAFGDKLIISLLSRRDMVFANDRIDVRKMIEEHATTLKS